MNTSTQSLTDKDKAILSLLRTTGAATATEIAVRLRVLPSDVRPTLKALAERGFLETARIPGNFDHVVYRLSDEGHSTMRLPYLR
jgi:DNA-binding MarR family transcriptional regulator